MLLAFRYLGQSLRKLLAGSLTGPRSLSITSDDEGVAIESAGDNQEAISFAWKDVRKIVTYKRDLFTYDTICLAFQIGEAWHEVWEEDVGFLTLKEAMESRFPSIPTDWYPEVMHPAFVANERTLWTSQ